MFNDLFNFKRQRTPREAIGFFVFYAGVFVVISALLGVDVFSL